MVRDVWEFLNKETKAKIIFSGAIVFVLLIIAIPYFVSALNNNVTRETNIEIGEPETAVVTETTESEENETATVASGETNIEETAEAEAVVGATEANTGRAASPANNTTRAAAASAQPQNQPAQSNTAARAASEPVVDDNFGKGGDDGYTESGVVEEPESSDPTEEASDESGEK